MHARAPLLRDSFRSPLICSLLLVASFSIRLVSIATQHFLSDVLHDARQYHKLRSKEKTTSVRQQPAHASEKEA